MPPTESSAASRSVRALVCAIAPVVFAGVVWWPIRRNYFHGDDFLHLYQIVDFPLVQWLLMPFGGHVYVLRNAAFVASFDLFGLEPRRWFDVVLATHLVNVALLFRLLRTSGAGRRVAGVAAAWWGTARVLEGALGWYSVYGQVLLATITFAVVERLVRHARRGDRLGAGEAAGWAVVLLAGCTAFGLGLGIALVFPVAALVALGPRRFGRGALAVLLALPPAAAGLWVGLHQLYGRLYDPSWKQAPGSMLSFFTTAWRESLQMLGHLLAAGIATLFRPFDDPQAVYPHTLAWWVVGACAVVVAVAVLADGGTRRAVVPLLVLAVGGYAIITAGRAFLWSDPAIPVFGATQPRYHYLATGLLAAALARAVAGLLAPVRVPAVAADVAFAASLAALALLYRRSDWTIDAHEGDRKSVLELVAVAHAAAASAPPDRPAVLPNRLFRPCTLQPPLFAGWASAFVVFAPPYLRDRVQFADQSEAVHHMARPGTRLAHVLVALPAGAASRSGAPASQSLCGTRATPFVRDADATL